MECPSCQRSITIPEGGVNAIPQNLHLGFEVEVARYMSKIGSAEEKSCDACIDGSVGPAVVFCCTCHHLLCKLCHDYHKRNKILHHHQIVGLDKESLKLLPSIMKPTEHLCSQHYHEKEDLEYYCETYKLRTCRDCTLVCHMDLKIADLSNIAKAHRDAMREALMCAQEVTSKLTKAINANDEMAEQVETSRQNATVIITQAFEQLQQTIAERKKMLLSEMEDISLSKTTALTLQKEQWMKLQDEIGRYTEMTSHILQTHTDHEMIALGDLLPTELKATLKKVEYVSLIPNQYSSMHVSINTDSLIKELSLFGHVMDSWSSETVAKVKEMYHIKMETMTSKGERYPYGGLQMKAELRPKLHDGAVVPGEVEDHGDGTYTITFTPQIAGLHQLLITMEGKHVQKSLCEPLDMRRKYSTLLSLEQLTSINCSDPAGIAIHDSGDIYVTCLTDDCIHVFDQAGQHKKTIDSKEALGAGQFNCPHGIFVKGDVMYIADTGNNCIQKLTIGGMFLQKFGVYGSYVGQFNKPLTVIVDQNDRLIVADNNNHRVVMLDQAGTWLFIITGKVSGSHGFQGPYGLALDPQRNIHVAANGSNTIKVFTPEGTCVRSYGDVKGPSGIVIDEEGYSFVNEKDGNCLSIFDPQGSKVHSVGNLNGPRGAILDPKSGSLYVANCGAGTVCKYSCIV